VALQKLDTGAKVGLGAAALALVIGVGWALSSGGSSTPQPTPVVSLPGVRVGPDGSVTVNDSGRTLHVGPDGVRSTPSPGAPAAPDGTRAPFMPDDGNIVPGRTDVPGGTPMPPSGIMDSVTSDEVVRLLAEAGHEGTVGRDNDGDPMIRGTIEGLKFSIFFYRCNRDATPRCLDLQFHASFSNDKNVSNEQMNAYNRDNRFGQAYFMANGEIGLDMSATLQGGVARQHVKEVIDWWKVTLTGFPKKFN
jgi:hypothetical protein